MDLKSKVDFLIERAQKQASNPDTVNVAKIREAYECASKAHEGQYRKNGDPYIIHPVSVAEIIVEMGLDTDCICAGLMHDCIEDTAFQYEQIKEKFGVDVANLVDGVTRLGQIHYSKEQEQMEDLRKMLIAMGKDIRVILIKLADRLHNMRTIQFMKEEKQRSKALETMEIYAPIAHRLGIQRVKWELEDLSLQRLDPVGYNEIVEGLARQHNEHEKMLNRICQTIGSKLDDSGIPNSISARVKHIYSIYRKMYAQNKSIDEIYDICAVRVIVESVADCYNVLGYVHDLYKPIPGRFKDYISTPKPNGYRSLHTTVIGRSGVPFEVQIRTEEMHEMAEYGIAAHWKYKLGPDGQKKINDEETYAWIRQLLESQKDTDAEDFIKAIKVDLFSEEVFVFTPRGEVVNLPAGSTPIDFAYGIHSAVGNRMIGCKINGRIAPIEYKLQNGDIVEILTSKETKGPKRDWLKIIRTSEARNKIKQWFKKECREENIAQGREDLERELRSALLYNHFTAKPEIQQNVLKKFGYPSMEELYAAIGYGGLTVTKVINKIKDEVIRARKQEEAHQPLINRNHPVKSDSGIIVEDIGNCKVKFARCCTPVPGDDIIGYITRGYGVSVHRKDCINVKNSSPEDQDRWIRVRWDEHHIEVKERFSTALQVSTTDRMGVMNEVLQVLAANHINIKDFSGKTLSEGYGIINIVIDVTGLSQLEALKKKIQSLKGVINVTRQTS